MNYALIRDRDIANGPGIRVSLYVSGCKHHCKGCFNQEAWSYLYGKHYDETVEKKILEALDKPYISGLSILGGDPFCQDNEGLRQIYQLCKKYHEMHPDKTIWAWTGYVFESLCSVANSELEYSLLQQDQCVARHTLHLLLSEIDVLVDGPFIEEKKNASLKYMGSSNQRIIDLKQCYPMQDINLFIP